VARVTPCTRTKRALRAGKVVTFRPGLAIETVAASVKVVPSVEVRILYCDA
jgi:hypothetical protein